MMVRVGVEGGGAAASEGGCATSPPTRPKPTTARVLPAISPPLKRALSTSILAASEAWSPCSAARLCVCAMPSTTPRAARRRAHRVSSLTALALAPGVLKTWLGVR